MYVRITSKDGDERAISGKRAIAEKWATSGKGLPPK